MSKIMITGVNGHIGSRIAAALLRDGLHVVGIDKQPVRLNPQDEIGTYEFFRSDINNLQSLPRKMRSVDILIHCAALVHRQSADLSRSNYFRINCEGTANVLAAQDESRLRQIIFLSTVSVYGAPANDRVPDETTKPAPEDFYGESKAAAEEEVMGYARLHQIPFTIFRLTPVYGKGFLLNLNKRVFLPGQFAYYRINDGNQRISLCSVNNVVDTVVECLDNKTFINEIYILKDPSDYSINSIIHTFKGLSSNDRRPTVGIPSSIPASVFKAVSIVLPGKGKYYLYNLNKITSSQIYSGEKLYARGVRMKWDLETTLRDAQG